ncbi:MAG: hypothetical protein ABIW79_07870 [Gemmatimonas sp.]
MRRKLLCGLAASLCATILGAQPVPARDLLEFPLGAVLEPAALAREPGAGLWNPAMTALMPGERWRFGVASLSRPAADQSIDGQLLSFARRGNDGTTLGMSIARSSVGGITRTDADPQSIGTVPYATLLISATAAREVVPHVTLGISARLREGRADQDVRHAMAGDVGILVHDLPWRSARFGVSSFLWRPGREIDDRPALVAAGDFRVYGAGARDVRIGYSHNGVNRGAKEGGPFIGGRVDRLEVRAAFLRTSASGRSVIRARSGIALHYARYVVGLAREEGASGLGPLYQFTLSSVVK